MATNALLERKGAKTAFVTTRGFEDLIAIGRQNRPELYNLMPALPMPLVPRELCFGVDERVLVRRHHRARFRDIGDLPRRIAESGAESVAICLLHSYQNDVHERALLKGLAGFVSRLLRYFAGVPRIRARQHDGDQRLCGSADGSLSRRTGAEEPVQSRDHAIEWRAC